MWRSASFRGEMRSVKGPRRRERRGENMDGAQILKALMSRSDCVAQLVDFSESMDRCVWIGKELSEGRASTASSGCIVLLPPLLYCALALCSIVVLYLPDVLPVGTIDAGDDDVVFSSSMIGWPFDVRRQSTFCNPLF